MKPNMKNNHKTSTNKLMLLRVTVLLAMQKALRSRLFLILSKSLARGILRFLNAPLTHWLKGLSIT